MPGPLGAPRRVPRAVADGTGQAAATGSAPAASASGWGPPASRDWRPDPAWQPEPAWDDEPAGYDRGWDDDATGLDAPPAGWDDRGRGDPTMAHPLAPAGARGSRAPYEAGPDAPPDWRPTPPGASDAAAPAPRHRPGLGAVLGVVGLVALVLALTSLPWFTAGDRDVTFADIRAVIADPDQSWAAPATPSPDLAPIAAASPAAPAQEPAPDATATTAAPVDPNAAPTTAPAGEPAPGATTPSTLVPPAEVPLGQAPVESRPAADGRDDYLERFTDWGWMAVVGLAAVAVAFSTLIVPRGRRGRMVTGFLQAGPVGLAINAVDRGGRFGPRVVGALVTAVAGAAYLGALDAVFGGGYAPDPAYGAWVGLGGLVAVLAGCLSGVRRRPGAAAGPPVA